MKTTKNPEEERMELLNKFEECGQEITYFVSKYTEFLKLQSMIFNESEREPIESITDRLGIGLGALEDAWEEAYAFKARLESEANLSLEGLSPDPPPEPAGSGRP